MSTATKRVTTAEIDGALRLAAELRGDEAAQGIQLWQMRMVYAGATFPGAAIHHPPR